MDHSGVSSMAVRSCVLPLGQVPELFSLSWGCCGAELDWGVDWGALGLHPAVPLLSLPFLFQEMRQLCFYKAAVSWQPGS